MAKSRKDNKGRVLRKGETQRSCDGKYVYTYVDPEGKATYDIEWNPNGSAASIEGITSPDGRIFGKMGHSERIGRNIAENVPGNKDQKLFESGVKYFK